jgi:hypothetical protein
VPLTDSHEVVPRDISSRGRAPKLLALFGLLGGACARPPEVPPAPPPLHVSNDAARALDVPKHEAARVVVRLASDKDVEGRVNVELRFEGPLAKLSVLDFRPTHEATIDRLTASDATGAIAVRAEGKKLELGRPVSGPLDVRYSVRIAPAPDGPTIEPVELRVAGEDVLALPDVDGEAPAALEIHVRTGGATIASASSFGLGVDVTTKGRASDLRNAYYVSGDVGTAAFHTSYGDDIAAWIGNTVFDPRWVSAEVAGVRTSVDTYVARDFSPDAAPVVLVMTSARASEPPIRVTPRTRGLHVTVDRRASWGAAARLLVATAFVQRYVGGFLWVGSRAEEASGWFFSDGFSRAIARDVLVEAGIFDPADRAAELNALLAATVFAEKDREIATARGALVATALDRAMRAASHGQGSLRSFVRGLLAEAAEGKRDTLPLADFMQKVTESAGDGFAREAASVLQRGAEIALPGDLAGVCYRLVRRTLVPFELGFTTSAGEEMTILSVKKGSRAEAAGIRMGDVVTKLAYDEGKASVPVVLTIRRGDRDVAIRFQPSGAAKPGRMFERIAGIPNERCGL